MQIKDLLAALAIPALVFGAAIPQDPEFPEEWSNDEDSIVGGTTAAAGDFPFIVSIQRSSGSHFCGGSLLNANTVITAAHCVPGLSPSSIRIRAGSLNYNSGGIIASVSAIRSNPGYVARTSQGDVAILKLATPVTVSAYAVLPASGSEPAGGSGTTVAGWGDLFEDANAGTVTLRKVDVPVVARATCQANYGASRITTQMFCAGVAAGGKDSCQGDSGGPIVNTSTRVLLGVVSWGDGCARPNAPGVYSHLGNSVLNTFVRNNL